MTIRKDASRKPNTRAVGGVGPAPGVGEGVELRLTHFAACLAEEDVVIGVRVEWRIEIHEIHAGVGEVFRIPQPFEVVPEVEAIHFPSFTG
jgi:hypothetical protein